MMLFKGGHVFKFDRSFLIDSMIDYLVGCQYHLQQRRLGDAEPMPIVTGAAFGNQDTLAANVVSKSSPSELQA